MKITIIHEFDNIEDAAAFLKAYGLDRAGGEVVEVTSTPAEKKPRKGRSDAGQTRGPNIRTTGNAGGSPTGGASPNTGASAPAEPTKPAAPQEAPAAKQWTPEAVRAELKKLSDAPNKGTLACVTLLQSFGVQRVSDLPPARYDEFVKAVRAQLES